MSAAESRTPATALEYALYYAGLGWSVVPVRPGEKLPAVAWSKFQTLPADAATIRGWFDHAPALGVGLVQGRVPSTIVLDFDGELGHATLRDLEARGLPLSVRSLTPGGGVHVILRHPGVPVATRKGVLPGMDVRGDGGFIVAPPSRHANGGHYCWDVDAHPEDVPVADCPAWLLPALKAPVSGPAHMAEVTRAIGPLGLSGAVVDGREAYMRDTVLAVCRAEGERLGRWPTEAELIEAAWPQYSRNVDLSRPGRGAAEFAAKCRYTLARAASGAIRGLSMPAAAAATAEPRQAEAAPGTAGGGSGAVSPLPIIRFGAVEPNLDAADFVEGLLIEATMSVIYGPSNCGKTFFCTDLALHVAAGWAWRGREVEAGGVIYCALEGAHGIRNRVAAFKSHYGILDGLPFGIVPMTLNLLDPAADTQRLIDTIKAEGEALGVPVRWVVMDTLSRAMAGGNENSPEDMGALVTNGTRIQQETGAHVTWIHHSGKDQALGARGHSLLRAATDTEIEISRQDSASPSCARVTKQRDLEIEGEFIFKLTSVELGTNRRGKPVTSCVVEPVEGSAPKRQGDLPKGAKVAMKALIEALAKPGAGQAGDGRDIPLGVSALPLSKWRAEFHARSTLDTQEARKKAFQRGVADLIEAGAVVSINDLVWVVQQP